MPTFFNEICIACGNPPVSEFTDFRPFGDTVEIYCARHKMEELKRRDTFAKNRDFHNLVVVAAIIAAASRNRFNHGVGRIQLTGFSFLHIPKVSK